MPIGACRDAQVLLNSALWLMALSYFCVSMIRTTVSDWSTVFLHESKGLPLAVAARCLFAMETGGFAGSLAAGAISDRCFSGRRGPVVAICSAGLAPALIAILRATEPLTLQMCYAWLGLCAFPVHVLLGLFSREAVPTNVSSSAGGFVKCIAQVRRQALHTNGHTVYSAARDLDIGRCTRLAVRLRATLSASCSNVRAGRVSSVSLQ